MNEEITVRKYRSGDEEGIVEALKASFAGWRKIEALKYWRWKYLDSPLGYYISVCESDGKIVAVHHDLKFNVKVCDSVLLTLWSDDLSVLPEYRSKGLWNRMIKMRNESPEYKEVKFKYASSANPIVLKSWKKRGFHIFSHDVVYMLRVKDLKMHLEKRPVDDPLVARLGITVLKSLNMFTPRMGVKKMGEFDLIEADSFDERIDDFWDRIKGGYDFIVERKKDYLNWRSKDLPWLKFKRILAVDEGGSVVGYTILRIDMIDDYHEGNILDLQVMPGREDVADALIGSACKFFDEAGLNVAYYRCAKGHPYQKLAGGRFVAIPRKALYITYEIFTPSQKEPEILDQSDRSRISLGYIDTI